MNRENGFWVVRIKEDDDVFLTMDLDRAFEAFLANK